MRRLEVRLTLGDEPVVAGTLAEQDRRLYFEYDRAFLAAPLPISPFKLPVRPGLLEHEERDFAQVFGVFNDSLPDGWGLLLMDREFSKRGLNRATLSVLDRLAYIGTRGMGALTYHPPATALEEEVLGIDLDALARQAQRVLEGSAEDVLPALRIAGGSPGGARPKVLVGVRGDGHIISGTSDIPEGYRHYLIKFPAKEDIPDIGAVEAAYALMAHEAGVDVPPTRLFETSDGGRYFGAERFDRVGNRRLHMHTLGGLLHASHRVPSLEYDGLLKATMLLTKDQRQVEEAFRRMVFNVLSHNRDDHVKNFSFLMDPSGGWRLAPAYDLVFSEGPAGQHTMAVAGEAVHPTERDLLRVAEDCDVDGGRGREIVRHVRDAVRLWPRFARITAVPSTTERRIGGVIEAPEIRR
ncbi:MAG: type II toxin-antitoxin system HipA family toxin [Chloroflexi bacterium]|nr:type II toxin-antitoxin system HipA family toxin [Chloroflexota bacterium]